MLRMCLPPPRFLLRNTRDLSGNPYTTYNRRPRSEEPACTRTVVVAWSAPGTTSLEEPRRPLRRSRELQSSGDEVIQGISYWPVVWAFIPSLKGSEVGALVVEVVWNSTKCIELTRFQNSMLADQRIYCGSV